MKNFSNGIYEDIKSYRDYKELTEEQLKELETNEDMEKKELETKEDMENFFKKIAKRLKEYYNIKKDEEFKKIWEDEEFKKIWEEEEFKKIWKDAETDLNFDDLFKNEDGGKKRKSK